jgi:hypothetical protein
MTFDNLIETVSEILENDKINKNGLILTYELHPNAHLAMNLELQHKTHGVDAPFEPADEFEVEISGILVKFIKKVYTEKN